MDLREVTRTIQPHDTSDGAGVRLRRAIGTADLDHLDPFLLFDEFRSDRSDDYIGGFPDHPHRGFETVTYMLAGHMEHHDHAGHRGDLVAGSIQWMTAGRGIIHSEMPQQEHGLLWGYQLWINLPSSLKMSAPRYQDIGPERVPEVGLPGASVRVLAGHFGDDVGPVRGIVTEPLYLDMSLDSGATVQADVPPSHNAFVYVVEGDARVEPGERDRPGPACPSAHLAVLGGGDAVRLAAVGGPMRCLLVAAKPIGEPIARYGPFVMNTRGEIEQALDDLRTGAFLA